MALFNQLDYINDRISREICIDTRTDQRSGLISSKLRRGKPRYKYILFLFCCLFCCLFCHLFCYLFCYL